MAGKSINNNPSLDELVTNQQPKEPNKYLNYICPTKVHPRHPFSGHKRGVITAPNNKCTAKLNRVWGCKYKMNKLHYEQENNNNIQACMEVHYGLGIKFEQDSKMKIQTI